MTVRTDSLRAFAEWASRRDVPRVGWPTSFLPPPGVHVRAVERRQTLDVFVSSDRDDTEYLARLDLGSREVLASPAGVEHRRLRRIALRYVADRNGFDRRCGLDTTPPAPEFALDDFDTWSDLQMLAVVTNSLWFPPDVAPDGTGTRLQRISLATRFNRRVAAYRKANPTPPPAG